MRWAGLVVVLGLIIMAGSLLVSPAASAASTPTPTPAAVHTLTPTAAVGLDHPAFEAGRWVLRGQVVEVRTVELFGRTLDVAKINYGGYNLWAAVGVIQPQGGYDSFIDQAANRIEAITLLSQALVSPERLEVSLYVAGKSATPFWIDWALCEPAGSAYCRLAQLVENNNSPYSPDLVLQGASNLFIKTGYFPSRIPHGLLVWKLAIEEH